MKTVCIAAYVFLLCASFGVCEKVKALTQIDHDPYMLIDKVTSLETDSLKIRVYETSGGDPAMNGNRIILNINMLAESGNAYTWDTGIDMNEVKSVAVKGNQIKISGNEQIMANGNVLEKPVNVGYLIKFSFEEELLLGTIEVIKEQSK